MERPDIESLVEIARLVLDTLPDGHDEEVKRQIAAEIAVMIGEEDDNG